ATLWAASATPTEGPVVKPMRRPPPTAALTLRKWRRERSTASPSTRSTTRLEAMSGLLLAARYTMRRALDSLTDARVGSAATDVSRHRSIDIGIRWVGLGGEQRR